DIALRVAGVVAAAVSGVVAVMDFVDANESREQKNWRLASLQSVSGMTGFLSAVVAGWAAFSVAGGGTMVFGLSLTGWGLILAVVLVGIGIAIEYVKGSIFSQWLEKTYWGVLPVSSRYGEPKVEHVDFNKIMAGM
ncbi:hypothetical protein, partial [Burkholderia metallica]